MFGRKAEIKGLWESIAALSSRLKLEETATMAMAHRIKTLEAAKLVKKAKKK